MIVVLSLVTMMRFAVPTIGVPGRASSTRMPVDSSTTVECVRIARSWRIAFLLSPYDGLLTTHTGNPRSLFITIVFSASPSMSSHMMKSGFPACETACSIGSISWTFESFLLMNTVNGLSRSASILSLVQKNGEIQPSSYWQPSTMLLTVSVVFPSSTLITPRIPILSNTSARTSAISSEWLLEILATLRISSLVEIGLADALMSSIALFAALVMPLRIWILFPPTFVCLRPLRKMLSRSTAVPVVPSPA